MHLLQIPSLPLAILVIGLSIFCAIAGMIWVRRRVSPARLKQSHEVANPVYQMLGVLYAVLMAFMVVVVWEQFRDAQVHADSEASRLLDLLRDARAFAEPARGRLQSHLIAYASDVARNEWQAMARGEAIEPESEAFREVWREYLDYQPETNREIAFYNESIGRLNELGSERHLRLVSSQAELPALLWVLLVGGGIVTVGFTYLFGTDDGPVQGLIVASLSGLLAFVIVLILSLEHPYMGAVQVKPDAFEHVIQLWNAGVEK